MKIISYNPDLPIRKYKKWLRFTENSYYMEPVSMAESSLHLVSYSYDPGEDDARYIDMQGLRIEKKRIKIVIP